MKPLNHKKRRASQLRFLLAFSITFTVIFCNGLFAIYAGKEGLHVLEKRHAAYNTIFEKQASMTFKIDEMTKYLYRLKNKRRTLAEHRQFQALISDVRTDIENEIENTALVVEDYKFQLYNELLTEIREIQSVADDYENEAEEYLYNKELLEKCREKYRADKA